MATIWKVEQSLPTTLLTTGPLAYWSTGLLRNCEPRVGIEPTLIPLPRERFTTKLSRRVFRS